MSTLILNEAAAVMSTKLYKQIRIRRRLNVAQLPHTGCHVLNSGKTRHPQRYPKRLLFLVLDLSQVCRLRLHLADQI